MRAALLPLAAFAVACNMSSDDKPDETGDTEVDILDTFPEDMETGVEDTEPPSFTDTGVLYTIEVEGWADVSRGNELMGWQTYAAKWIGVQTDTASPPPLSEPRCIYAQDLRNWENDPDRNQQPNPILPADFDRCTDCLYAFTITLKNARSVPRYPWKTDPDTGDTAPPEDDVVEGKLNCETLVDKQGYVSPEDLQDQSDYVGFGYDPEDIGTVNDGIIQVWLAQYNSWSPYAYTAAFDDEAGVITWIEALPPYEYTP